MSSVSAIIVGEQPGNLLSATLVSAAWRNLWRNRRRTWLMAGGIAFAVWLLAFSYALHKGILGLMVNNSARIWLGHAQVQHQDFADDPNLEYVLADAWVAGLILLVGRQLALAAPALRLRRLRCVEAQRATE